MAYKEEHFSLLKDIIKVLTFLKIDLQTCDQIQYINKNLWKKGVMKFFFFTIVEIKRARW